MIIRKMCGKKTLILFRNSQIPTDFKLNNNIEVVIGSRRTFNKYKEQIKHNLHSKVKLIFIK